MTVIKREREKTIRERGDLQILTQSQSAIVERLTGENQQIFNEIANLIKMLCDLKKAEQLSLILD